jgi:exopolysaccharide production protein ExoZ
VIKNIQYLRFLAAALVVFAHANMQIYGLDTSITNLGGFGVDLFFVISGFLMPYIIFGGYLKDGSHAVMGGAGFLWRRFTRIWPMYCITIATVLIISYFVHSEVIGHATPDLAYIFNGSKIDAIWFLETMSFTHFTRPPILGIGWTLQIEFFFYFAISLVLAAGVKTFEGLEAGLILLFFVALALSASSSIASAFANPMIIEFMLGFFLYRLVSRNTLIPRDAAIAVLVLTIPLLLQIETNNLLKISGALYRPVVWGIGAFFLTWAAISLEKFTPHLRFLELLGNSSYSLYLTHGFIAPLFVFYWVGMSFITKVPGWLYLAIYFITCQSFAYLAYKFIETPLNTAIRKRLK